jgi:hypothetical protein
VVRHLVTVFLLLLVVEAGREAYLQQVVGSRHYSRVQIAKELPWWAQRKSGREHREHQRHWHIDLRHPSLTRRR